ncbi:hypothetical protein GCM10023144_13290 [Pigmentiphaga soli]|uniref:Rnf electron transport complex subunit B n=1 Tax=Pigmentiphaga soli TaxID=1007095 RepID=A0ABP8GPC7_9BURK
MSTPPRPPDPPAAPRPHGAAADAIDAILPQTQCARCGFDGCRPYAEAIACGEAGIDRCPPGGDPGIAQLASLLGIPVVPLDTQRGRPGPLTVAVVDERHCIGCTLCIQACPLDAIVGANKRMHTVLPDLCSGCELCVAPCPVDCIRMEPAGRDWTAADADAARARDRRRARRLGGDEPAARETQAGGPAAAREADAAGPAAARTGDGRPPADAEDRKRAILAAALARARARRGAH